MCSAHGMEIHIEKLPGNFIGRNLSKFIDSVVHPADNIYTNLFRHSELNRSDMKFE